MKQALEDAILRQDIPQIEDYIKQYEEQNPSDFDLYSYRISLCLLKKDFQMAYHLAKEAVNLNPFDIEANYNLMVCADLTEQHSEGYKAFLLIQFMQSKYLMDIIDSETLSEWEQHFQKMISDENNILLKNELLQVAQNHHNAVIDPFKNFQSSLCGKILRAYNDELYYIGLADNTYDAYFNPALIADPIHAKCELFRIKDIGTSFNVPQKHKKTLLPVCLNFDDEQTDTNYIYDASVTPIPIYMEPAKKKYSYLPIENGAALKTGFPAIFCEPLPLSQKDFHGRKKLVLSIFIDSFNYYIIKEMGLKELMPESYRYFSKGIICNNFYSGSEWTLPSIATYWTGKHAGHHMNLAEEYRFDFMKDSKVLAEYFHDNGYVTAKIGGNDAITPWQGYMRGIDRFIYQSTHSFRKKEVIQDTIQHLETFKDACQYVWLDLVDLHHVAGGFMRSIQVQSKIPLSQRTIDNTIRTSVKQTYSPNRKQIYIQELRELDFYLGNLYNYLEKTYQDREIIVSLFSDHGTSFMVGNDEPFLSEQRVNVPFMLRGSSITPEICNEIIESTDYAAIICKLADIPYNYHGTDANLPITFGGTFEREFAFSQSIFIGDPYRAALHGKNLHCYLESKEPVSPCFRINLSEKTCFITDNTGNIIQNKSMSDKFEAIVKKEINHLLYHKSN